MVYPHESSCFKWDGQDRLTCTFACRRHHPRAWKIRREQDQGCGCLPGRARWRILKHNGGSDYVDVAGADTFGRVLAMVNRPTVWPEPSDVPA